MLYTQINNYFKFSNYLYVDILIIFIVLFSLSSNVSASELKLTKDEIEYLKFNTHIKVANETDWPPFDYMELGKPKGLAIDFIKLLANKVGLKIEFVNGYSWNELVNKLKNKELDVIPAIYRNTEREKFTLFTPPYYKGKLGIFTPTGNQTISTAKDLIGKKVGIQKEHGAIPLINNQVPGISLTEVISTNRLVTQLATGKLDAIIGNPLLFSYIAKEYQISNIKLSSYIEVDKHSQQKISLHIGVRNDMPLLHSILSKAIAILSETEINQVHQKWSTLTSNTPSQIRVNLSNDEIEFITSNPVIRTSNEMDYPPFDFAISDQAYGFSIDMLNLVAKRSGLNIKYVNGYNWSELLDMFNRDELDLMHTVNKTLSREQYALFSKPFHYYRNHFVIRKTSEDIKNIHDLSGKIVAVTSDWSSEEFMT